MLNLSRGLLRPTKRSFAQFENAFYAKSKPKAKVISQYEALPPSLSIDPKDPFDYPLRSIENVMNFLKDRPKKISYSLEYEYHLLEIAEEAPTDRFIKASFKVGDLNMTKKQKERLIFLCGERYDKKTDIVKIRVDSHPTKIDNYKRLEEIMEELYMEALRAP